MSHYQQMPYPPPQSFAAPSLQASSPDSELNDCACSPCCEPGHCCAPSGACPCFCTRYTTFFSTSLIGYWLSVVLLVTALSLEMYWSFWYGSVSVGPFGWCTSWSGCHSLSDDDLNAGFNGAMFQAFRVFLCVGLGFSLFAGILTAIRLAYQQRAKEIGQCLEASTLLTGFVAFLTTSLSLILSSLILSTSSSSSSFDGSDYDVSYFLHCAATGLVTYAFFAHCATLHYYTKKQKTNGGEMEEGASVGYSSAFSHPAPPAAWSAAPPHYSQEYAEPGAAQSMSQYGLPMPVPIYR